MTTTFAGVAQLASRVGDHLGHSQWIEVDQQRIDRFGDATGDRPGNDATLGRSAPGGPDDTTVAQCYLALSLIPYLAPLVYRVEGVRMSVNYGCERVRFPGPVLSGARVRLGAQLLEVGPVAPDGHQVRMGFTVEVEGSPKPACVAEVLFRYYD